MPAPAPATVAAAPEGFARCYFDGQSNVAILVRGKIEGSRVVRGTSLTTYSLDDRTRALKPGLEIPFTMSQANAVAWVAGTDGPKLCVTASSESSGVLVQCHDLSSSAVSQLGGMIDASLDQVHLASSMKFGAVWVWAEMGGRWHGVERRSVAGESLPIDVSSIESIESVREFRDTLYVEGVSKDLAADLVDLLSVSLGAGDLSPQKSRAIRRRSESVRRIGHHPSRSASLEDGVARTADGPLFRGPERVLAGTPMGDDDWLLLLESQPAELVLVSSDGQRLSQAPVPGAFVLVGDLKGERAILFSDQAIAIVVTIDHGTIVTTTYDANDASPFKRDS